MLVKINKLQWINCNALICRALIFNAIMLLVVVSLFEPTTKSDDYDISMVMYGAVDGIYSIRNTYVSVFFSTIITSLLQYMPDIAWYSVTQYFFIYVSLFVVCTIFNYMNPGRKNLIVEYIIFLFLSYELYIRLTFTKTAGIIIISGLLLMLYMIEHGIRRKSLWIFAYIWILVGCSIRRPMLELILAVFFSTFIINIFIGEKVKKIKVLVVFFISVICVLFFAKTTSYIDNSIKKSDERWANFLDNNKARSGLQDYSMPEYIKYEAEYKALGITQNDYLAWKKCAIYDDYDFFTPDKLLEISKITDNDSEKVLLCNMGKNILAYYFSEPGFYFLVLIATILCYSQELDFKRKIVLSLSVIICCVLSYAYMFFRGRLEHHVDVCVMIAAILILNYYFRKYNCSVDKKALFIVAAIISIVCQRCYTSFINSSYYELSVVNQKIFYENNKRIMGELSKDKEHIYVFDAHLTNGLYCSVFLPFEVIPKGFYSNLAISNRYYIPTWDNIADDYGVDNYYKEATDSDLIYFVCAEENREWIEILKLYINEHYCENAKYELVRKIDSVAIYRFKGN